MNKKIEDFKELLNVLPRNNVKNSRAYFMTATMMKDEVTRFKKDILRELKNRYRDIIIYNDNEDLNVLNNHLEDMKKNLYLLNEYNDSFEKSNLDVSLYRLKKFYKNDLLSVNQNIKTILDEFALVGVDLVSDDFFYGKEVSIYMDSFLHSSDLDSTNLKDNFDKLYWKDPDLLHHIYLNFRYLYFKHKASFDKYYDKKLVENNITDKNSYLANYKSTLWNYLLLKESNMKIIQDKFLDGSLEIKEFDESKISKIESSLIVDAEKQSDNVESINKLSYTLYEYKNYLKYKNIVDEIKNIYKEKESNKAITKGILKEINKHEGNIIKLNKKMSFKLRFFPNSDLEKYYSSIGLDLKEIKKLYEDYDAAKFKEVVANKLTDNSTILDALRLVLGFKNNLAKIIKKDNEDMADESVDKIVDDLEEFSNYPNSMIISNLSITDERDVAVTILDKYKLMNIKLDKEQLDEVNLDSFIANVNKVVISNYMKKSNIKYEDFNNATEIKKILDKENIEI